MPFMLLKQNCYLHEANPSSKISVFYLLYIMYCFLGELVFRVERHQSSLSSLLWHVCFWCVNIINVSGKSAYLLNHVGFIYTLQSNCHNLIIFPAWSSSVTSSVCYWFTFNRNTSLSFLSPWFSSPFTSTSASSREGLSIACALHVHCFQEQAGKKSAWRP